MSQNDWRTRVGQEIGKAGSLAVLGIGNELMGDDGAGILAAKLLRKFEFRNSNFEFIVFEAGTTPENFTGPIGRLRPELVLMIDAADMGLGAGQVAFLDPASMGSLMHTTHNMPLSFLADYIERTAGCRVAALGIQAAIIDLGAHMSPEVAAACRLVAGAIAGAIEGRM
jgi:hydrogenase 3 maturation protease